MEETKNACSFSLFSPLEYLAPRATGKRASTSEALHCRESDRGGREKEGVRASRAKKRNPEMREMLSKHTSNHPTPISQLSPGRRRVDLACDLAGEVVDKRPRALGQGNELDGLAQQGRRREDDASGFRRRRRRRGDDGHRRRSRCLLCVWRLSRAQWHR